MVNLRTNHQDPAPGESPLDALVMLLDLELTALRGLQYRLTVLRLMLIYGHPEFIHLAAGELGESSLSMSGVEGGRAQALERAAAELSAPTVTTVSGLAAIAPEPHAAVLHRLGDELAQVTRSIDALRDGIRTASEDGQRSVRDLLDLTDDAPASPAGAQPSFVGEL